MTLPPQENNANQPEAPQPQEAPQFDPTQTSGTYPQPPAPAPYTQQPAATPQMPQPAMPYQQQPQQAAPAPYTQQPPAAPFAQPNAAAYPQQTGAIPYPQQAPSAQANISGFFSTLLDQLKQIWRGTAAQHICTPASPKHGLLTLGIYTLELALLFSLLIGRSLGFADLASGISRSFGGGSVYFVVSFGTWFSLFVLFIIGFAAILALRVACLHIVFTTRKASTNFLSLAGIYSYALTPAIFLMPIIILFILMPSPALNIVFLPIFCFISTMCAFLAEILTYVGINRAGRFQKSPLVPYVASFALWNVILGIISLILSLLVTAMLVNASMSYVGNYMGSFPW